MHQINCWTDCGAKQTGINERQSVHRYRVKRGKKNEICVRPPTSNIKVTPMQTGAAYFNAGHEDLRLARAQIPGQMGGWHAQQERLCAGGAPANHSVRRRFPTLEYSGDGRGV